MSDETTVEIERQQMEVDIACVGFGPAMGGFLTALTRAMEAGAGEASLESKAVPGMPLQVLCYERSDDIAAGVSGVVTRGRAIRESFPEIAAAGVPMLTPVKKGKSAVPDGPDWGKPEIGAAAVGGPGEAAAERGAEGGAGGDGASVYAGISAKA